MSSCATPRTPSGRTARCAGTVIAGVLLLGLAGCGTESPRTTTGEGQAVAVSSVAEQSRACSAYVRLARAGEQVTSHVAVPKRKGGTAPCQAAVRIGSR